MTTQQAAESGHVVAAPLTRAKAKSASDANDGNNGHLIAAPLTQNPHADNGTTDESKLVIAATLDGRGRGPTDQVMMNLQVVEAQAFNLHSHNSEAMCGDGNAKAAIEASQSRSLDSTGGYSANQGGTIIAFSSKDSGNDATEDIAPTLRALNHKDSHPAGGGQVAIAFDTTQITSPDNRSQPAPDAPCHPLSSSGHAPAVALDARNLKEQPDGVSGTLRSKKSGGHSLNYTNPVLSFNAGQGSAARSLAESVDHTPPLKAASGGNSVPSVAGEAQGVRRLTPRECERLQGFPDDWTRWDSEGNEISDSARYRMLGNAVVTKCSHWIGNRLRIVNDASERMP